MSIDLFMPETIMSVMCFMVLCAMVFMKEVNFKALTNLLVFGSALLIVSTIRMIDQSGSIFSGAYRVDMLSQGFKILIVAAYLITLIFSKEYLSLSPKKSTEYLFFLSTSALGMMMMASCADLISLYVAMELSSYSLYLLTALRQDRRNAEAGLKYLIFGAAASGVFLWGAGILMGLSGGSSFSVISSMFTADSIQPALFLGLIFICFSFLFKLSAFPLHFWAPDVYESASTPVTNFVATASKAAAIVILIRIFMLSGIAAPFANILGLLAFLSMTLGNTVALVQKDVKRLLAYSSIAQAGYVLVGLLSGTIGGFSTGAFYAAAYVLMNSAVFLVVLVVAKNIKHDNPQLSHFDGLAERSPLLALVLLMGLLSLAGIPPLAGFTGKWILFASAMQKGHWFLVLWAVLNSVVSLFYYLTLVRHAYVEKPLSQEPIHLGFSMRALCFLLLGSILALGIFPDKLITFTQLAIQSALNT
jgi:NADH-quinone oxidoreductase subunit N